ncbi:MAG: hypothetical protein Q9167_003722 [Letrouitia subvulpina]
MNRDYRITAEKNNIAIDRIKGDDLSKFPIEHARLRSIWCMIFVTIAGVTGYGWALQAETWRVDEFQKDPSEKKSPNSEAPQNAGKTSNFSAKEANAEVEKRI